MHENMITKEQVMALVLEACPSFRETWNRSEDQELLYIVMGDLARHLLALHQVGRRGEFGPFCELLERLHNEGDGEVRNLATIGILESIQNMWEHPEEFRAFLLPESKKWWKELNDFWAGKIPYVGAGLQDS